MDSPHLLSPFRLRDVVFRNRVGVSPMCQYSSEDGFATDWHLVHLGSRAVGGAGLVFTEATAVVPEGRISPQDLGIWKDEHCEMLQRIAGFIKTHGAVAGIQLAHAGRKASVQRPWEGGAQIAPGSPDGWQPVAPSPIPFRDGDVAPHELTIDEIAGISAQFAVAAGRALAAGFQVVEIHGAHGYLMHSFLSPLSNQRADAHGGSFDNRIRFALETVRAVRQVWPERLPLFLRISASDWTEGGWTIDDSIELARRVKPLGVDLIDCSSGGNVATARIPVAPGYQVPFAEAVRQQANISTASVGMITDFAQAEEIIASGKADIVLLAREMLRDPYFPLHAGGALHQDAPIPVQYERAYPKPAR